MYVETDFLLALVKPSDWLAERANAIYEEHSGDLWTSDHTLVELMLVAYKEDMDVERVVIEAKRVVEVRGDAETVLAAASHVEENEFTPFDALHLVRSGEDAIVTSERDYDGFSKRVPLEPSE